MGEARDDQRLQALAAAAAAGKPIDAHALEGYEFGGRVACQTGAALTEDRREHEGSGSLSVDDARRQDAARAHDYKKDLEPLSFDERVEKTMDCLERRASYRNILYGLLRFCCADRSYEEAEAYVEGFPEYKENRQLARRYVSFLLRTGAIEETELDENGLPITERERQVALDEGLAPEDLDLLVCDWSLGTTDVGREALDRFSPARRLRSLVESYDSVSVRTCAHVLDVCRTRRSIADINRLLAADPGLKRDSHTGVMGLQPSSYVNKLDHAGGLEWNDGWKTTEEGERILEELRQREAHE